MIKESNILPFNTAISQDQNYASFIPHNFSGNFGIDSAHKRKKNRALPQLGRIFFDKSPILPPFKEWWNVLLQNRRAQKQNNDELSDCSSVILQQWSFFLVSFSSASFVSQFRKVVASYRLMYSHCLQYLLLYSVSGRLISVSEDRIHEFSPAVRDYGGGGVHICSFFDTFSHTKKCHYCSLLI